MCRLVSSPDAVGNLTFQDIEVPTPKANECLIRVKAFSMNRGELKRFGSRRHLRLLWQ
jgi:NADPH:quinone reductase-like Zn-dependent oxidoreductase